jgi:hypothetical protein
MGFDLMENENCSGNPERSREQEMEAEQQNQHESRRDEDQRKEKNASATQAEGEPRQQLEKSAGANQKCMEKKTTSGTKNRQRGDQHRAARNRGPAAKLKKM